MVITETDIAIIHALLKDYQWYLDNYHNFALSAYRFPMFATEKDVRPYREVRDRIANTAPLLTKALSMELPQGFSLLKTIDEQCLAWKAGIGLHGPVSEFQARLWCWQNEQIDEEIKFNIVEDEDEEVTIHGVDEAVGDHMVSMGILGNFRESLGGMGHGSAVLDESMIDTMFKPYREANKA